MISLISPSGRHFLVSYLRAVCLPKRHKGIPCPISAAAHIPLTTFQASLTHEHCFCSAGCVIDFSPNASFCPQCWSGSGAAASVHGLCLVWGHQRARGAVLGHGAQSR